MDSLYTSGQLIDALKKGKTLVRIHHQDDGMKEELKYKDGNLFSYGWGSALGLPEHRLKYLFTNPEQWTIAQ